MNEKSGQFRPAFRVAELTGLLLEMFLIFAENS
jgi:hypothetical protein